MKISAKNDKFGYLNPILGNLGWRTTLVDGSLESPWSTFYIRLNWTFFAIYYGPGIMRRNVYSSAVFAGGRPLCTQILPGQGRPPSTILGIRKLGTLDYPTVKTVSLCVPSFWHLPECDEQTDGRTDEFAEAYAALAQLALWRFVKIAVHLITRYRNRLSGE